MELKRLSDLTFEELVSIVVGSEEYQQLIDLECAHAGIRLLPPHPGPKPVVENAKPDLVLYKLGNWCFDSSHDVEEIIELMIAKGIYKTVNRNGVEVAEQMTADDYYWPSLSTKTAYSGFNYSQLKDALSKQQALVDEWKIRESDYSEVFNERKEIIERFEKQQIYANEVVSRIKDLRNNLDRYLILAQGIYQVAINFLKDADKSGQVLLENDSVFYVCSRGQQHYVISYEEHKQNSVNKLLEV